MKLPFDAAIIAARPVRWTDWPQEIQDEILRPVREQGAQEPPIYPGSIFQPCEGCRVEIAVGPRSQAAIEQLTKENRPVSVLCFYCAALDAATEQAKGSQMTVSDLGNPYQARS